MTDSQLSALHLLAFVWLGPSAWVWLLLFLASARWIGVGCILAAVIGTRRPIRACCGRCRYPVVEPPHGACSECGQSLDEPRAVRRDAWGLRRRPLVAGLLCVGVSLNLMWVIDGLVVLPGELHAEARHRLKAQPKDRHTDDYAEFPVSARRFVGTLVAAVDPADDEWPALIEYLDDFGIGSWTDLLGSSPARMHALREAVEDPSTRERALALAAWIARGEQLGSRDARSIVADALCESPAMAGSVARWADRGSALVVSLARPVDLQVPFTVAVRELALFADIERDFASELEYEVVVEIEHADGTREILAPLTGGALAEALANHPDFNSKMPLYQLPRTPDPLRFTLHVHGEVRVTLEAVTLRDESGAVRRARLVIPFAREARSLDVEEWTID